MMRKGCVLLTLALAGAGCVSPGTHVEEEARKTPVVQMAPTPPPAPPAVTADQVTEANAAEMAQALARELDHAAIERPAGLPTAPKENVTKP